MNADEKIRKAVAKAGEMKDEAWEEATRVFKATCPSEVICFRGRCYGIATGELVAQEDPVRYIPD